MATAPYGPFEIVFDDGEVATPAPNRVDLLRLERVLGEPVNAWLFDRSWQTVFRLAWVSLQREKHPRVEPHVDLSTFVSSELQRGIEALSEVADVNVVRSVEVAEDDPKSSDLAQPTGGPLPSPTS